MYSQLSQHIIIFILHSASHVNVYFAMINNCLCGALFVGLNNDNENQAPYY